jgi:hypothetical protein
MPIEGITIGQYGPWGLVSIFFMLVFLGGLIPRWVHKQRIEDKEEVIKYLKEIVDKRDKQFDDLIRQNEVTIKMLEDIKRVSTDREATRA